MAAICELFAPDGTAATVQTRLSSSFWEARRFWTRSARSGRRSVPRKWPKPRRPWKTRKRRLKPRAEPKLRPKVARRKKKNRSRRDRNLFKRLLRGAFFAG